MFEQKLFPLTAVTKRRNSAAKVAVGNLFVGKGSCGTTMNQTKKIGQRVQKLKQVHIRTSPDASPENVDVFVGSDSTNSVTAPCL